MPGAVFRRGDGIELRRVTPEDTEFLATNEASRAVLETLGFVEEGRERAAFVQDGVRVDRVNYGLLADEFDT